METAIQEEIQRAEKLTDLPGSETFGSPTELVKHTQNTATMIATDERKVQELERVIMDLQITNRGKDMFIEHLKNERSGVIDKLMSANRTVGRLEIKLLQIEALPSQQINKLENQISSCE